MKGYIKEDQDLTTHTWNNRHETRSLIPQTVHDTRPDGYLVRNMSFVNFFAGENVIFNDSVCFFNWQGICQTVNQGLEKCYHLLTICNVNLETCNTVFRYVIMNTCTEIDIWNTNGTLIKYFLDNKMKKKKIQFQNPTKKSLKETKSIHLNT